MKRPIAIAITALALAGAVTLGGCSANVDIRPGTTPGTSQTETANTNLNAAGVSTFLNDYYNALVAKSTDAKAASSQVETVMREVLGQAKYDSLGASSDPVEALSSLGAEDQKTLADRFQVLNPLVDYYDMATLDNAQRAYLNLVAISSSAMMVDTSNGNYKVEVSVPGDKVDLHDEMATVTFTDIVFKINGERQPTGTTGDAATSITLHYVDGKWRIDGRSMIDNLSAPSVEPIPTTEG